MRIEGTLAKWKDDRGFGFIAPIAGGPEVFVHISTFPKDGIRPQIGERLSFEIETGNDGKKQAKHLVCLDRTTLRRPTQRAHPAKPRETQPTPGWFGRLLTLLLVAGLGYYGYNAFMQRSQIATPTASWHQIEPTNARPAAVEPQSFRCDGRQHCSQMTSCAEAKYFLRYCPNVKMDGDYDGRPCETGPC